MNAISMSFPDWIIDAICNEVSNLEPAEVRRWFELGWIESRGDAEDAIFLSVSTQRAHLIREVRQVFGVADDSVDIVIGLIEKLQLETQKLTCLSEAIDAAENIDAESVRLQAARIFRARMR